MSKGPPQQQQPPRPGPNQQWKQPQHNQQQPLQQRRNAAVQIKLGAEVNEPTQRNIPLISTVASAQTGPKLGAKRTVMQRTNISLTDGQQLPQKVRVIKLCGAVSMPFSFLFSILPRFN